MRGTGGIIWGTIFRCFCCRMGGKTNFFKTKALKGGAGALEEQGGIGGAFDIRFCGFRNQSELPAFFDIASVFVLPARHEPWGLVVNEAMNAARAVVISDDVGCHPDLVRDGVEGFVFPIGDVDALAETLLRVLATPETAAAMGR